MTNPDGGKTRVRWLKAAALVTTWGIIYFFVGILTKFTMAPWDTAMLRPEMGTWQQILNDFFETGGGYQLFAGAVVLGNMYLALRLLSRQHQLPWRFIINNAVFVWLYFHLSSVAGHLNNMLFPIASPVYDHSYIGYHRSIIPALIEIVVIIIWFMVQSRLLDRRKRKRQASDMLMDDSSAATDRLALEDGGATWNDSPNNQMYAQQGSQL